MEIEELIADTDYDEGQIAEAMLPMLRPLKDAGLLSDADLSFPVAEEDEYTVSRTHELADGFVIRWGAMLTATGAILLFCEGRFHTDEDASAGLRLKYLLGTDGWIAEFEQEGVWNSELVALAKRIGIDPLHAVISIDEETVSQTVFQMTEIRPAA